MTIAAAYLTSEGVILGADSTTTIQEPGGGVVQLLNHAQKVYEVGQGTCFGFCTFGAGRIGNQSHRTISALLGDWLVANPGPMHKVTSLSAELVRLLSIEAARPGATPFAVGYFLGGIDPDRTPACAMVVFEFGGLDAMGQPTINTSTHQMVAGEARFQGAPDYFARIFHGYAPGLPEAIRSELNQELVRQGALPPHFDTTFAQAFGRAAAQFTSVGFSDLPIREAIDYIHTYLAITIKAFKFRFGPAPCGGPIEIAYISSDRCFRWARHKSPRSAIMEYQEIP